MIGKRDVLLDLHSQLPLDKVTELLTRTHVKFYSRLS